MAKMKTEFELQFPGIPRPKNKSGRIILFPKREEKLNDTDLAVVWVKLDNPSVMAIIPNEKAELLAINILKALKSKRLKP